MKLFCTLDVKANHYLKPFSDENTINAIRGFEIAVNEGDNVMRRFPDDFALCELGDFDRATGAIKLHPVPVNIASGRSLVRPPKAGGGPQMSFEDVGSAKQ